jgi:FMN phosphatase YigB (HAD superfamily)
MNLQAISFDFGDTLFPHRPRELEAVLEALAAFLQRHVPPFESRVLRDRFLEIRDRQFAENRAALRENDFAARLSEIVAFLNAAQAVDPALIAEAMNVYSDAMVAAMRMPPWLPDLLEDLAGRYRLAVISNYPLSAPIFETLRRNNLDRLLAVTVVSADIGFIKPHPAPFEAALAGLGVPAASVVHVGDDWDADIVGAHRAGMRAVYTRQWRDEEDRHYGAENIVPLAEIDDLRDLPAVLGTSSP